MPHCSSCFFTLKFDRLDNVMDSSERFGSVSFLNAKPIEQFSLLIKDSDSMKFLATPDENARDRR